MLAHPHLCHACVSMGNENHLFLGLRRIHLRNTYSQPAMMTMWGCLGILLTHVQLNFPGKPFLLEQQGRAGAGQAPQESLSIPELPMAATLQVSF